MIDNISGWRWSRLILIVALLMSVVPLTVLASSHQTATRAPASITSTVVEVIDPGEEWMDEAGVFHVRNLTQSEEVSGDISGTAIVTVNIDFLAPGQCDEQACPAYTEVWGHIEITGEGGRWTGNWMISSSDVPDDEYAFSAVSLRGSGAAAGQSFFGEFVEETEESVTIEGVVSTLAMPTQPMNLNVNVCFAEEGALGGYLGTGLQSENGQAEAFLYSSGFAWTHTYDLTGIFTLSDEFGSVTLGFVGGGQDIVSTVEEFTGHGWGSFVILEGTGEYAEFYGQGRAVGTASTNTSCASGFGVNFSFIGETHYN